MKVTLCAEFYRTPEQGADSDDYMVDGMKILHLEMPDAYAEQPEMCDKFAASIITAFMAEIQSSKPTQAQNVFPKFTAMVRSEKPFWFHLTTTEGLSRLPKDFHGNNFSESELLGIPVAEELSIHYSTIGLRLDGPPDKFMLSLGAV
jgi:hypothetical protein